MDKNDSVIEIPDSPCEPSSVKRKRDHANNVNDDYLAGSSPKHPLLGSNSGPPQQHPADKERKIEKVHSDSLKPNVACPKKQPTASYAASQWTKENGFRESNFRHAQDAIHGQTGISNLSTSKNKRRRSKKRKSWSKNGRKKSDTRQSSPKASKTRPVRTSTVTSASMTTRPGTSETEDYSSASVEENISMNSLRNRDGEVFASHLSASTSDAKYICPILYCEVEFSSARSLGKHMNLFLHSPCNPCRYARDTRLLPKPLCYKCPECDLEFNTRDLCSEHMNKENHLMFYPPLEITAYLCPQCLYLFATLETCWNHMETSRHHRIRFPFKDDDTDSDFNLPVAVAKEFVQDYISKCKNIAFQVQCLDCGVDILTPENFQEHLDETNNFHVMSALTETVLADIFSTYLKPFCCDTCHRLFYEQPATNSKHICADGIIGNINADIIGTTSEFAKCCALSLITSLKGKQSRKGTITVGKVNRSKKHDPSEILHFQVEQNEPESLTGAKESVWTKNENEDKGSGVKDSTRARLSDSLPAVSIYLDRDEVTDVKVEPEDSIKEFGGIGNLNNDRTIKVESFDKVSFENLDRPLHLDQVNTIKQEPVETDYNVVQSMDIDITECKYEPIENVNETTTTVKSEFPYLCESEYAVYVKPEKGEEGGSSHTDSTIEQIDLKRLENDRSNTKSLNFLKEEPSTSSGRASGENFRSNIEMKVEDSESDNDYMEISDCKEEVETITISESDSDNVMIDKRQSNSKIVRKKKKKVKRKQTKKETKALLKRLAEDSAKTARQKFIKFLSKEEKIKEENPEQKKLPGRQAKTAANDILERRKNRALAIIEAKASAPSTTQKKYRLNVKHLGTFLVQAVCKDYSEHSQQARNTQFELSLKDQNENLISTEHLIKMKNIIFLDLDNFPGFFKALPQCSTDNTFVWIFYGGNTVISQRMLTDTYYQLKQKGLVYISERCGRTKDAADFALVLTVGKMDERLPTSVKFTILSGDKGFCEVERQMQQSQRSALVINPHMDKDILPTQLQSIYET